MVISDLRANTFAWPLCLGAMMFACAGTTASAGVIPNLSFQVQESTTGYNETINPAGASGPFFYNYGINVNEAPFSITGDINASPDLPGLSPALLSTSLSFTNNHTETLNFIVTMTLPMSTGATAVDWTTSASWVLAGPSADSELVTIPGMPLWAVFIDNTQVATLYDDFSGMGGTNNNLNTTPKAGSFGPVMESISIQLAFSLTPGATGGPTGGFSLIPAPGALALFAGLFVGSRRRRE